MTKKNLEIHSENILPIIKKWLYSDRDIFVRELVSNACDALFKLKVLRDQGEVQPDQRELRIDINIDKNAHALKFIDTGIGMTSEEVQKYIAQIAFSGAEEFLNKYKNASEQEQVIGHFGLGFYSSYMVAAKVDINTLSYKPNSEAVFWSCDGSSQYEIDKGHKKERGTEIILHIDSENSEYLEEPRLKQILQHYCNFMPYPIYLNGKLINSVEPLWIKSPTACSKEDYLQFYRHLYPFDEDPLFWIHLNVDYPFHLKGILYFPKIHRKFDINKSSVKLYCNRVFVSDNCKDVLPEYLMALRGIIDSSDIPLNVSRSYLQMDRTVRQLSGHISKKVSDSLNGLYRQEHDRFIADWNDLSLVIKLGALEDDKFYERVKDILIWKTTEGQWTTAEEYLQRNKDKTNDKIFYTRESTSTHFLDIYRSKNIEVLIANNFIDSYLISLLEKKLSPAKFQRVDAALDDALLDKEKEKTILDAAGKTEATKIADFFRNKLSNDKIEVHAKSLASSTMPAFILIDENQRRMQEYLQSIDSTHSQTGNLEKHTFVVNTNNPLVSTIRKLDDKHPELAKEMALELYDMALLSQKDFSPKALHDFICRTTNVLEKLAEKALLK